MNIENLISQERQILQKEYKKTITAGFLSKSFQTFAYKKQCAEFDDYLTDKWQWSVMHRLRDTLSGKLFIGEKAVMTSSIFSTTTSKVDDYGGFAIREPFGEVSFCHVATFSEHKSRSGSGISERYLVQDEKGILIYFPNVYKHPATENLVIRSNRDTDNDEVRASIGLPPDRKSVMQSFFDGVYKELTGKGNRLTVPDGPFAGDFMHHFEISCKDADFAGHVITNSYMENLLTLRKAIARGISVSYVGADIYLFIHGCDYFIRAWRSDKDVHIDTDTVKRMNMLLNHTGDLLELILPKEEK